MFLLSSQMAFPSHTSRSQTTVKQPHCVSSHLSITTTISLKTHLPLTKPTSKSVVSKLIFGSSWMMPNVPLSSIRYPTTAVLDLTSLLCVWHFATWKNYQKTSNSLPMDTVLIRLLLNNFSRIRWKIQVWVHPGDRTFQWWCHIKTIPSVQADDWTLKPDIQSFLPQNQWFR